MQKQWRLSQQLLLAPSVGVLVVHQQVGDPLMPMMGAAAVAAAKEVAEVEVEVAPAALSPAEERLCAG